MSQGRRTAEAPPAGGPIRHIPVLVHEAVAALAPVAGGVYVDGTFGAGGYAREILGTPGTRVVAFDRDPSAIAAGAAMAEEFAGRLTLVHARFSQMAERLSELGFGPGGALGRIDGVALDIGVSSMQFDEGERGFSFRFDGPLDMRMSGAGPSAADLVNGEEEARLADIFYHYGEERASRRIARAIVAARAEAPVATTRRLAEIIARAAPGRPGEIHPATRSFQGLRIAVNDELGELARALGAAEAVLTPGGALAVVTFHSLEDRIVKQFFADRAGRGQAPSRLLPGEPARAEPTFAIEGKPAASPTAAEVAANPRARSARLRAARRTGAPALGVDARLLETTNLPAAPARRRG